SHSFLLRLAPFPHLSFFLLPTLRPPRPTLFPYTTLFRSAARFAQSGRIDLRDVCAQHLDRSCRWCPQPIESADQGRFARTRQAQDRKSTRLNSSHVSISYAVFCLKKKKSKA